MVNGLKFQHLIILIFLPCVLLCCCFLKYSVEWQNSVDWSGCSFSLIWVCTLCICHFIRNFGVQNFQTFTIYLSYLLNNQTSSTTNCIERYSNFVHILPGNDVTVFVTDLKQLFHNQETTLTIISVTLDKPLLIGQLSIDHMIDEMNETRDMIGFPTFVQTGLPTWFQTGVMTGLVMVEIVSEIKQRRLKIIWLPPLCCVYATRCF